ncbi:MAG: methylmalonyl Co-A mutase-associated GTPase MeaB [Flavobacteriales bacterium CG18_big_fil_WC_8_21_14_2_50_32_9]|nr:MAG: methylmalonyl Co-A mutase-associated GTPase MeaB [Flavobacteriales bacterium CG18_big_fil_WC_8_21_14_2_50_32_9]
MKKNINNIKRSRQKLLSATEYVAAIQRGDVIMLSKAITLVESSNLTHQQLASEIVDNCLPFSGNSLRIGITGVPGVGKSTFIEALGNYLITEKGKKIAVLAIDPSSGKTGGSILGDKTRMNLLSVQKDAFIRPSPSAGTLGGVARATRESIILCEAAGFDIILIETVGVGQSETEVNAMVDFFLLLMLAGAGDELQGIKRGIMEMADAIVINKAEENNIEQANLAKRTYQNALHLFPPNRNDWMPKVTTCSALYNQNIAEIWQIIDAYHHLVISNGFFEIQRKEQLEKWFEKSVTHAFVSMLMKNKKIQQELEKLKEQVLLNQLSPYSATKKLLNNINV